MKPDYPSRCPFEMYLYDGPGGQMIAGPVPVPAVPRPGDLLWAASRTWQVASPAQWITPERGSRAWAEGGSVHIDLLVRPAAGIHAHDGS